MDDITQGMSDEFKQMWQNLVEDATVLGVGVMVIYPDMKVKGIAPDEYHVLSDDMNHAQGKYIAKDNGIN